MREESASAVPSLLQRREGMKHFEITEWADFVRGLTPAGARKDMETHLAACKPCQRTAKLLSVFSSTAAHLRGIEAPTSSVHCAETLFALQETERKRSRAGWVARLVFDSFREPLPAGVRSGQRLSRQVLFEAGAYRLDLRLERESGTEHFSLVGQIENRKQPRLEMGSVPVMLTAGRQVVARGITNRFGEFQFSYRAVGQMQLFVVLPQEAGRRIAVPVHKLFSERVPSVPVATRRPKPRSHGKN